MHLPFASFSPPDTLPSSAVLSSLMLVVIVCVLLLGIVCFQLHYPNAPKGEQSLMICCCDAYSTLALPDVENVIVPEI
jgi:hypothetical protein